MKRLLIIAALAAGFVGGLALADVIPGARLTAGAKVHHGDWRYFDPSEGGDAGFLFTVCGYTKSATGLKVYHFDNPDGGDPIGPCEPCEPGPWSAAPSFCTAQWKTNRGL